MVRKSISVRASPLNTVKLDLAIIISGGGLLLILLELLLDKVIWQVLLLLVYGLLGMVWIILRVRQIMNRLETDHGAL